MAFQVTPLLKLFPVKKLVGKSMTMSFTNDKTFDLWRSFMPERRLITNSVSADLYSIQVFSKLPDFRHFNPNESFEKWAAVEVNSFENIPTGMESFVLKEGLYAVFIYKGKASEAAPFYASIFRDWLPTSGYTLDDRPHFAIMGAKYKNDDPDSEEEICIPVKTLALEP